MELFVSQLVGRLLEVRNHLLDLDRDRAELAHQLSDVISTTRRHLTAFGDLRQLLASDADHNHLVAEQALALDGGDTVLTDTTRLLAHDRHLDVDALVVRGVAVLHLRDVADVDAAHAHRRAAA
jgi:hypothetical protein